MSDIIVFLDLETTGLDPLSNDILEVGCVAYDLANKHVEDERNWVIHFPLDNRFNGIVQVVFDMHMVNGLWYEADEATLTLREADDEVSTWLRPYRGEAMAGNTIGFDRSFLKYQMPQSYDQFTHRNWDVSVLNLFASKGLLPNISAPAPKGEAHRAIEDCHSSIAQMEYYLERWGL